MSPFKYNSGNQTKLQPQKEGERLLGTAGCREERGDGGHRPPLRAVGTFIIGSGCRGVWKQGLSSRGENKSAQPRRSLVKLKPCPCYGTASRVGAGGANHRPRPGPAVVRKLYRDADTPPCTRVYATAACGGISRVEMLRQTPCGSQASSIYCLAFYIKHLLITAGDRHWLLCARTHAKEPTEAPCTTAKGWRTQSAQQWRNRLLTNTGIPFIN